MLTLVPSPVITTQPTDIYDACPGISVSFSVTATGSPVSYQWQVSTNGGVSYSNITAAGSNPVYTGWTSATLGINNISPANNYVYRCIAGSTCLPNDTSDAAHLWVSDGPGPVTVSGGGTYCGSTVITASGLSGFTVYFQGTTSGGTSQSNPSTSETITSSGIYYFRTFDGNCWGTEGSAAVSINAVPGAVSVSGDTVQCGGTVTLHASGGSGGTIYWQGMTSGGISTATASTSQTTGTSGTYYFRSFNQGCWGPEGSATVTINAVPGVVSVSGDTVQCGGTVTLQASGGLGGTLYWQGMTSGGMSTATASSSQTVDTSGTYYFRSYNQGCWGSEGSATVTIEPAIGSPVFIPGPDTSRCQGAGTVSYTASSANSTYIAYSLDATSLAAGNTIDTATGFVNFTAGWSGISVITATAYGCGGPQTVSHTVMTIANVQVGVSVLVFPSDTICSGETVTFTAVPASGIINPFYQWYLNGDETGSNIPSFTSSTLNIHDTIFCRLISDAFCVTGNPASSNSIVMTVNPGINASLSISTPDNPACENSNVTFSASPVHGGTNPVYQWYLNHVATGNGSSAYSCDSLANGDTISCVLHSNEACVMNNPVFSNTVHMVINQTPIADAGTDTTYSGTPILIGNPSNGPGTISWSPATGLNNPTLAQPAASPSITTTYTLTVDHNGCVNSDTVKIIAGGAVYTISGKTRYLNMAIPGIVGVPPTYNSVLYNIDKVIVILKDYMGAELARDTSDALGNFQFINIADGNYALFYDKYTQDTMQWGNDVNAIDVALIKHLIGCDTLIDPSRNFSSKYKKAANVDNNASINSIDISRIKAKIGSPYNTVKNFPQGNWIALDTAVIVAGSDLNIILKTICYGDYNASCVKYRDSLVNWGGAKSLSSEIIVTSDEYVTTSDPSYFEVPLRISTKINEFSAMSLELNYPSKDFRLVSAVMPNTTDKNGIVKINPTLEEIIADDNDLLVTDEDGVIRVVYATTNHYDVAANDKMIILGFAPANTPDLGEVEFSLSGTGVLGDQYGNENEDAYLIMPKVFIQGAETGFEFSGYPNPFYGEATLNYNIPENGNVKLTLYNAIGELVNELVNESQMSGKHAVEFSPKSMPAGMYTFKLEFEGQNISKCLVLKLVH